MTDAQSLFICGSIFLAAYGNGEGGGKVFIGVLFWVLALICWLAHV
jgi:hypothetical protein